MNWLKKPWLRYVLLLLLLWLLFVVVRFPAERGAALLQEQGIDARLVGIEGSAWQGRAEALLLGGQRIERLRWDVRQTELVQGRLAVQVAGEYRGQPFDVLVGRSLDGGLFIRDRDVPLAQLDRMLSPAPLGVTGSLDVDLHGIRFDGRRLRAAEGEITVHDGALGAPANVELGDYRIVVHSSEQGITGTLSDDDAQLGVDGTLVLQPGGLYHLTARLTVRDPNSRELRQALSLFGATSAPGQVTINRSGRLPM